MATIGDLKAQQLTSTFDNSTPDIDELEKAVPVGAISQRKNGVYKKVGPGKWVPVKGSGKGKKTTPSKEEKEEKKSTSKTEGGKMPEGTYSTGTKKVAERRAEKEGRVIVRHEGRYYVVDKKTAEGFGKLKSEPKKDSLVGTHKIPFGGTIKVEYSELAENYSFSGTRKDGSSWSGSNVSLERMKEIISGKKDSKTEKKESSISRKMPEEGASVRINQQGAKLISLEPFEGKDLKVEKIVNTGLISEPQQVKVTDGKGNSIIVSAKDLKESKPQASKEDAAKMKFLKEEYKKLNKEHNANTAMHQQKGIDLSTKYNNERNALSSKQWEASTNRDKATYDKVGKQLDALAEKYHKERNILNEKREKDHQAFTKKKDALLNEAFSSEKKVGEEPSKEKISPTEMKVRELMTIIEHQEHIDQGPPEPGSKGDKAWSQLEALVGSGKITKEQFNRQAKDFKGMDFAGVFSEASFGKDEKKAAEQKEAKKKEDALKKETPAAAKKRLSDHLDGQSKGGSLSVDYGIETSGKKMFVVAAVNGKRGYPRDADRKAMNSKPSLPAGFKFKTGKPVYMNGKEMTAASIKKDDEYYDDRGYQDSEFYGEARFEIVKDTMKKSKEDELNEAYKELGLDFSNDLEKGKKVPIGTISNGRKKVAEGKWVNIKSGGKKSAKSDGAASAAGKRGMKVLNDPTAHVNDVKAAIKDIKNRIKDIKKTATGQSDKQLDEKQKLDNLLTKLEKRATYSSGQTKKMSAAAYKRTFLKGIVEDDISDAYKELGL